jgi:hydroxypyruvate isomerase
VSHSLGYDVNCSIIFTELPLLRRSDAAKRSGFEEVEFWWPFPSAAPAQKDVNSFVDSIEGAGVRLVSLNFYAGDMPNGDRGIVSDPARVREFRDHVDIAIEIGERLGCRLFNALYGNRIGDTSPEAQDAVALENLEQAARAASRIGGTVLIEPLSGAESYPLRKASQALAIIDNVKRSTGLENLALLADIYHLHINGEDLDSLIADHTAAIAHVQIADAPGRHEPGTGSVPLMKHLSALEAAGYTGRVGLEYVPSGNSVESFGWIADSDHGTELPGRPRKRA